MIHEVHDGQASEQCTCSMWAANTDCMTRGGLDSAAISLEPSVRECSQKDRGKTLPLSMDQSPAAAAAALVDHSFDTAHTRICSTAQEHDMVQPPACTHTGRMLHQAGEALPCGQCCGQAKRDHEAQCIGGDKYRDGRELPLSIWQEAPQDGHDLTGPPL